MFELISPTGFQRNCSWECGGHFHLTLVALLHYLAKFENSKIIHAKMAIEIGTNYNFHDFQGSTETHLKIDEKLCNTYRKISLKI